MIERFAQLPHAVRNAARWERLGNSGIPVMLVHPDWGSRTPVPVILWMHGRTAHKELDPGRYLRWMRAQSESTPGLAACAIDLPGHGERFEARLQEASSVLEVVRQMVDEIDEIIACLSEFEVFDLDRIAIGGMSAGGMAALARLCRPHSFRVVSVEATSGSWEELLADRGDDLEPADIATVREFNPLTHLHHWRPIPFQAIHTRADQLAAFASQERFVTALRQRYADPSLIDFVVYESTGAPAEHIGFGRMSADAKDRQRDFLLDSLTA